MKRDYDECILYASLYMGRDKPYLQAACICDRIIIDKEDNSASIIRIIGRFTLNLPAEWPAGTPNPAIPLTLFVCFTGGDFVGNGVISVIAERPNKQRIETVKNPVSILANQTSMITGSIQINNPEPGLYWFEVFWNEALEARVPLFVEIVRSSLASSPKPA